MGKVSFFLSLSAIALLTGCSSSLNGFFPWSDDEYYPQPNNCRLPEECAYLSAVTIGGSYAQLHLKPQGSSALKGNLGGLEASYKYRPYQGIYCGLDLSWLQGSVHGESGKRDLMYIDAQEQIGYTFSGKGKRLLCTFFSGLGYRHLTQKLVSDAVNLRYNTLYIPVGIAADCTMRSWLEVGLHFTWMPQVYPTVSSNVSKDTRLDLHKTVSNFTVEMPFDFTLTENNRCHLIINPFYEHWKDGNTSTAIGALTVPSMTYEYFGVNVSLGLGF